MKFKELVSKLNEKLEEGKPETTKAYASGTPGQGNIVFTPEPQYDGHKIAQELDPTGGIEKQVAKARTNLDIDADGDVDAMDKKNDNIPDEVTGTEKKNRTLDLIKKGAAERAHTKKGVAYESVMVEKLSATDDTGKWIDDFQSSSAPQFAGKNAEERRKMAVAAKLSADKAAGKTEEVEEGTYHDSGWKKSSGQRKDSSGNVIKNFAKHLAKKGAAENDPNRKLRSDEKRVSGQIKREEVEETRVLGRITSDEVQKVLGPTKNAQQGIAALKKAFKVDDKKAKEMLDKAMKSMSEEVEEMEEQAPVAPTLDKKYIKGTPEHKAYMATKKPLTGHPTNEDVEQIDESEDKTLGRLKQLVRFGLMDKSKLPILARAMKSLEKGQVTNPTERATLFELLNELVGLVTGDDAMFAKVRMNVQKEEVDQE